jgi:hypothetical protein
MGRDHLVLLVLLDHLVLLVLLDLLVHLVLQGRTALQ